MRNQQTFATHADAVAFLNTIPSITTTDQWYIVPLTTSNSTWDSIIRVRQDVLASQLNAFGDVDTSSLEVMMEDKSCVNAVFARTNTTTTYTLYYYTV